MVIPDTIIKPEDIGQIEGRISDLPHIALSYAIDNKFGADTFKNHYWETLATLRPSPPLDSRKQAEAHNLMASAARRATDLSEFRLLLGL